MMSRDIFSVIREAGYEGGLSIFNRYCGMIRKNNTKANLEQVKITRRFVSKHDIVRYIWSGKEMDENDRIKIYNRYPELTILEECVKDFRDVFTQKTTESLNTFIKKYSESTISNLKSSRMV